MLKMGEMGANESPLSSGRVWAIHPLDHADQRPGKRVRGAAALYDRSGFGSKTGQLAAEAEGFTVGAAIVLPKAFISRMFAKLQTQLTHLGLDGRQLVLAVEHALDSVRHLGILVHRSLHFPPRHLT